MLAGFIIDVFKNIKDHSVFIKKERLLSLFFQQTLNFVPSTWEDNLYRSGPSQ